MAEAVSGPRTLHVRRDSTDLEEVGGLLAKFRELRGLSRSEVAASAGVTEAYVGMVERGKRSPGVEAFRQLLKAVGAALSSELVHDERVTYLWVNDPESDDPV